MEFQLNISEGNSLSAAVVVTIAYKHAFLFKEQIYSLIE